MRFVIQRVREAAVRVEGETLGEIGLGFVVLIGVSHEDDEAVADKMVAKLLKLRIFEDENGKTNLDIDTVQGQLLLISQFTLYADCRKGNRPSFVNAGGPEMADALYQYIIGKCRAALGEGRVATGSFGADMKVSLVNDGPFTVILDSADLNLK